ncbi:DNA-3-methyladenine glycosylase family protein [Portibacter marinus]|uniref:DNA-3-methyladenine glycosylase family protein n=1 Tax=Portibacter marinus TaxID=2898660 RepID=UPI001F41F6B5|nr:DNA-3-methyladenine glycosylase 2 family protein [Portibacter marinus]
MASLAQAKEVLQKDPVMRRIIHIEIDVPFFDGDVNAYLYSSIISQQLSTKAADAIYSRFLNHFDGNSPSPDQLLAVDFESLRSLGLSNAKVRYISNVAEHFKTNSVEPQHWHKKSNDQIIKELTAIKGVGVWTVQMVLIFCLARRDVFPILDLGVRNSAIDLYNLTGEKQKINQQLLEIAEAWRPFRSFASLYLWRWRNLGMS